VAAAAAAAPEVVAAGALAVAGGGGAVVLGAVIHSMLPNPGTQIESGSPAAPTDATAVFDHTMAMGRGSRLAGTIGIGVIGVVGGLVPTLPPSDATLTGAAGHPPTPELQQGERESKKKNPPKNGDPTKNDPPEPGGGI